MLSELRLPANGNVTQNVRGSADWRYAYDSLDQLTREKLVVDGRTYQTDYNLNSIGALVSQTTPGSRTISFDPNGLGQATGARLGSAVRADNIVYHRTGGVQTLDYGNGLSLTNSYNARNLLTDIEVMNGGTPVVDFAYGHDTNGRITSITDGAVAGQNRTYNYDAVGRLVTANGPWGNGSFEYDSLGNLRRKTLGARIVEIEYDDVIAGVGTGRLSRARDTADGNIWRDYAYDDRGNVDDNDRLTFTYDRADQPVSIAGAATGAFVYDGNYKRVKQVMGGDTVYSVYSQSGAILYRDNATTGVATDYIRAAGMTIARIKGTSTSYLHQDHLGSPVAGTSTTGNVQWREHWSPFGETLSGSSGTDDDEGFTGHIRDEATGLIYMQARYYDPIIGRFLSNDPVSFSDDQPQMFNRYSYVGNDPVNAFDPFGAYIITIRLNNKGYDGYGAPRRTNVVDIDYIDDGTSNTTVFYSFTNFYYYNGQIYDIDPTVNWDTTYSGNAKYNQSTVDEINAYLDSNKYGGDRVKDAEDYDGDPTVDDIPEPRRNDDEKKDQSWGQCPASSGACGENSSGGQASTSQSIQTGSKFHGNAPHIVDGRATRLHRKDD